MPDDSAPTPTWVKVFALIAALVLIGFVVSLLLGVEHGPGLHGGLQPGLL